MKRFLYSLIFLVCSSFSLYSQQISVSGKVVDGSTGEAIIGASVVIKGSTIGTITDVEGNYKITISDSSKTLNFSFLGYKNQEVAVGSKSTIDVKLEPQTSAIDEVVVVGYGTTRKIDLTGSVSSVKTKDVNLIATTSVDQMLQGRAAGLTLTSVSAQPGSRLNVNIRGGSNPLYVIDGVPILSNPNPNDVNSNNQNSDPGLNTTLVGYSGGVDRDPLNGLNPDDIETVDILKDASAAAIYGSAAADGVILITTKKGKAGKVSVDYRGSYTTQTPKNYFQLMNAQEFMTQHNRFLMDQAMINDGSGVYGTNTTTPDITGISTYFSDAAIKAAGQGTDWLNEIMRDGMLNEHNISMSGGTEYTKVYASFNYYGNNGLLKNSTFDRYTGRINAEQQINDRVKAIINMSASQINANNSSTGSSAGGPEKDNMLQAAYVFSPTVGIKDSLGNYSKTFDNKVTNPAAFLIIQDYTRSNRFMADPKIEIKLLNDLKLHLVGGMDRKTDNRYFYLPKEVHNVQVPDGCAQLLTKRTDNYSSEAYFDYNHTFGNSSLTIVGGTGYYKTIIDGFGLVAYNFFTDAFSYNNVSIATNKDAEYISSFSSQRTKISEFFRVNYSLQDKYMLSFVGRNDASSIFAQNKKSGFFPGISGAWKINKESFMSDLVFISETKLRLGYGTAGNEGYIGNNPYTLYNSGYPFLIGSTQYPGVALSQIDNPNLTWETDATFNIGLDLGILANRITATIDYFNKTKRDLISYNLMPSDAPVGTIAANVGSQKSKGWEFAVTTNNFVNKFKWTTNITLSTYSLNWLTRNPNVALASWIKPNDPVNAVYGWKTAGIIKTSQDTVGYAVNMGSRNLIKPGQLKYVDINKDGKLDDKDVVMLCDGTPKWSFGFNNTFRYSIFDLNIYIYGLLGRKLPNGYMNFLSPTAISDKTIPYNTIKDIKNVYSNDNQNGIYPGLSNNTNPYTGSNPSSNTTVSSGIYGGITNDFWLVDGSFARIKNITLGVNLPETWTKKINIKSARIYLDLQNLYVFTNYKGVDPEITEANPYPQTRSTTFGVNISF